MRIKAKEIHRIKDGVHEVHVISDSELDALNKQMDEENLSKQEVLKRFSRSCEWVKMEE